MFLQEKTFQHPYLSALGAHTWVKKPFVLTDYIVITCLNLVSDFHWPWSCYLTCSNYWRDHDTALFILRHLYRDIPEESPTDDMGRRPIKLFYERDPFVEETPLTFADEASVKEFSRKVRTHTRKQDNDANCEASWWYVGWILFSFPFKIVIMCRVWLVGNNILPSFFFTLLRYLFYLNSK